MPVQYIASTAGVLKVITCVIGLFALGFGASASRSNFMKETTGHQVTCRVLDCPDRDLTLTALSVVWFACIVSIIVLIVLLFVEVGATFRMIDFIGHVIGGILLLCACGVFFNYCYTVHDTYDCSFNEKDDLKQRACELVREEYGINNFLAVAGLSLLNGIVYIITGIAAQKK